MMTDKYCKDCKYFEWQRAQPVCMRQQHRLIDGWRVSGCALDAEMERIAPNGCGQDARYFEPKDKDHPGSEYDCLFSAYRLLEVENTRLRHGQINIDAYRRENAELKVKLKDVHNRWEEREEEFARLRGELEARLEALSQEIVKNRDAVISGIMASRDAVIEFARADERQKCWRIVNNMIKPGDLGGNGMDMNAQRNGLIMAANALNRRA